MLGYVVQYVLTVRQIVDYKRLLKIYKLSPLHYPQKKGWATRSHRQKTWHRLKVQGSSLVNMNKYLYNLWLVYVAGKAWNEQEQFRYVRVWFTDRHINKK